MVTCLQRDTVSVHLSSIGFAKLLTEDEKQLDVDERMAAAARRMQESFYKQAEIEVK